VKGTVWSTNLTWSGLSTSRHPRDGRDHCRHRLVHDLDVWTQDDDFDVLAELAPDLRVRRG
jgi:hypothetical protein